MQISPSSPVATGCPSGSRMASRTCGAGFPTLPGRLSSTVEAVAIAVLSVSP